MGTDGPLSVDDLLGLGVPRSLVDRMCAWTDWVWEDFDQPVPQRVEPGWGREGRRLAYELQHQLPDVEVFVDAYDEHPPVQRPLRRLGLAEDEETSAEEAERPSALTVMAGPSVEHPVWTTPFGRCLSMDPTPLFVSPDLVDRLRRWNRRFPGPARLDAGWCADGLVLARALQDELWDAEVFSYEDDDGSPVRGRRR